MPTENLSVLPQPFARDGGELCCEGVPLSMLCREHGTPLYVYSSRAIIESFQSLQTSAPFPLQRRVCFAVKANPNLGILSLLVKLGAGFDIVSSGELQRVIRAGGRPEDCVFSGVGKSAQELGQAVQSGVGCINVESQSELLQLSRVATSLGRVAPISMRINPDIDAKTHPYISTGLKENKFGLSIDDAHAAYRQARSLPGIRIVGVDCHIGSQITQLEPFVQATQRVLMFVDALERDGIELEHIDLGGGLGIRYRDETPPSAAEFMSTIGACVEGWLKGRVNKSRPLLMFEFGRAIVGAAGLLLTRVEVLKPGEAKNFAVVDAAMNDLMRPSLYEAWHEVISLTEKRPPPGAGEALCWDLVGPVCESGDWLARNRCLPLLAEGDFLALASAGAYGSSMASNYNSRPRPAEVVVHPDQTVELIRHREQLDSMLNDERVSSFSPVYSGAK
ncbi:MAG: diaminopimelate decarboxylase [Betaproteobacteria bacterium]|nr:diaminopimelate decarboxylase [Betaproteobacteria bacterium]